MNKRVLLRAVFLSISGLAVCSAAATLRSASAADPAASASAITPASASASAAANEPVGPPKREPPIEPLEKQTIPAERSPVPKLEEWKNATPVHVERRSSDAHSCDVLRVREWLKVKCDISVGAIYQHAGTPEGVSFWVRPIPYLWSNGFEEKNGGEMIFPLRPGDRRLLQFFHLRQDPCVSIGFTPSVMVDETWIEGDPGPTVVLR